MEDSLRRFLQVASLKREASGLDPEAVHLNIDWLRLKVGY
jgi:hypothetical protein